MTITYSAEEIFQIGVEIEMNGQNFYQAAADAERDPEMAKLFSELASWEEKHIKVFEALKKGLADQQEPNMPYDPEDQYYRYLKAAADSHIFVMNKDVLKMITSCDSPIDILRMAMQFEKDSVVLYTSMKNLVPEGSGRDQIDRLIQEEVAHVSIISQKIKSLRVQQV